MDENQARRTEKKKNQIKKSWVTQRKEKSHMTSQDKQIQKINNDTNVLRTV